jgi:Zn-dependent protease
MYAALTDWREEAKHIILADAVLTIAFSLTIAGGLFGLSEKVFLYYLPIAFLAVTLNFILHEMMHKFTAQHYGAQAAFVSSPTGLMITLVTGALGFLFGIPGATMIYTNRFTKKENGIVSLAGPLTNLVVFLGAFAVLVFANPASSSYLFNALQFVIFISLLLGFFNMLPIFPLDGSKVLAWNKAIYLAVILPLLGLMLYFNILSIFDIVIMLAFAAMFSLFYRRLF